MKTPNFIFIGADRCGSKWLHNILKLHPDVFVPEIADPYFFDRQYDRGWQWYADLFKNAPATAKAVGELSHDYIHSAEAARRIKADLPDVKLLATIRHPVERAFSSYQSGHNAGAIEGTFSEALKNVPMLKHNSRYHQNLQPYFELFPAENIKILLFDDLNAKPVQFAKDVFEFLEIPFIEGLPYEVVFNPLKKPRGSVGGTISKNIANGLRRLGLVSILGWAKHRPAIRKIFYKDYDGAEKPSVEPEIRRQLLEEFESEIQGVELLLNQKLPNWRL